MRIATTLAALLLLSACTPGFTAVIPSPTPTPVVSPTPTPTPTPTPEPSIKLSDGNTYTVSQIEQAVKVLQERIKALTQQRDSYVGQVIDLSDQLKALQAQRVTPAPAKP